MDSSFFHLDIVQLGIFILGSGYLYTAWRKGGNSATSEVITALKEQHVLNVERIDTLNKEVGELRGKLAEKEDRIKTLEQLVKVTPEQQQYMDEMRSFTKDVADYMANSTAALKEVGQSLSIMNSKNLATN